LKKEIDLGGMGGEFDYMNEKKKEQVLGLKRHQRGRCSGRQKEGLHQQRGSSKIRREETNTSGWELNIDKPRHNKGRV